MARWRHWSTTLPDGAGAGPTAVSADASSCNEANLAVLEARGIAAI